jgi:hypothetical protein
VTIGPQTPRPQQLPSQKFSPLRSSTPMGRRQRPISRRRENPLRCDTRSMERLRDHTHPIPNQVVYPLRRTIMHTFEMRDVYMTHRPSPVARLELVLAPSPRPTSMTLPSSTPRDGRAVTTLSGPRIRHLFQLFRPDLTHRSFEEEVYLLITRLGSRSEIHTPTPATTARNRWATREDLQHFATHSTFKQNSTQTPSTNPYTLTPTTHSTPKA